MERVGRESELRVGLEGRNGREGGSGRRLLCVSENSPVSYWIRSGRAS